MHRQKDKSISRKGDGDTDREREKKWEIERERERGERERERERERKSGSKRDQYTDRRAPGHNPINGHTDTRAPGHNPDSRARGHTGKGHQSTALSKSAGGATDAHWTGTNEDASVSSVISMGTLIDLPAHSFSVMGRGSTQEPPRRLVSLSLHCCRNLCWMSIYLQVFGVWFGLRWIFSEDHHCIHEVQPRDLL